MTNRSYTIDLSDDLVEITMGQHVWTFPAGITARQGAQLQQLEQQDGTGVMDVIAALGDLLAEPEQRSTWNDVAPDYPIAALYQLVQVLTEEYGGRPTGPS